MANADGEKSWPFTIEKPLCSTARSVQATEGRMQADKREKRGEQAMQAGWRLGISRAISGRTGRFRLFRHGPERGPVRDGVAREAAPKIVHSVLTFEMDQD